VPAKIAVTATPMTRNAPALRVWMNVHAAYQSGRTGKPRGFGAGAGGSGDSGFHTVTATGRAPSPSRVGQGRLCAMTAATSSK
jgi:hypothetical protein